MTDQRGRIKVEFETGEKLDLEDFFMLYFPLLNSYAFSFISDPIICEDIVQEVFVSFWEKRKVFSDLNSAKAYLYTSVRNACFDQFKHAKVKDKYIQHCMGQHEVTDSCFDEVIRLEAYSEVYKEINKLPPMGKNVLLLFLRDKSNEEISNILNISINTVKTHKARAYKVLRGKLQGLSLFFINLKMSRN